MRLYSCNRTRCEVMSRRLALVNLVNAEPQFIATVMRGQIEIESPRIAGQISIPIWC